MDDFAPVLAFLGGIGCHLFFFKQSERFLYPVRYLQAVILSTIVGTVAKTHYQEIPIGIAFSTVVRYIGIFLVGLYASLLTYRLFFNPLNKFPGPYLSRVSKFNFAFGNLDKRCHHHLHKLHQKHGKFVRIGPNDLSVTDPEGVQAAAKLNKAPWYAQDTPLISMHTTRDRALHDRRRRVWSPAFSDKALRGYETRVQVYNDKLLEQLGNFGGKPVNVSKWFNLYSFDVMGDLGFGKSFGMLDSGETHWAIKLLNEGMDPLAFQFPQWFFRLLVAIPGLSAGYHNFIGFCSSRLEKRMNAKDKVKDADIIQTLIEQYNASENKQDALPLIQGDSRLIIVAGSDTTAACLIHLFYWLAKEPGVQKKLREELLGLVKNPAEPISHQDLLNCDMLNGCINESLRLNPPVPSGVFRITPPEGLTIGNTFVPGNTKIQFPSYPMGHDESCFTHCEEFIPERFYSKPDLVKHKDAWNPFWTGTYGCIGKNLAYMEMRTVITQILQKFDVTFAPGEDGSKLLRDSRDHFTMELAEMNLIFNARK